MRKLARGLLLAPPIFVAHVLEESQGFVAWFNAHAVRDITADTFWAVNAAGLVIAVLLAFGFRVIQSTASILAVVAGLSFLMLTNAIIHIVGAIVDRAYVPGLVTAIVLYVPYCAWIGVQILRSHRVAPSLVAAAAVLGGLPMAVHGYRLLFLGSRLF